MSVTYSLLCRETNLTLWVGQGASTGGLRFYSGIPDTMEKLGRFLWEHREKDIVLLPDYYMDGSEQEFK